MLNFEDILRNDSCKMSHKWFSFSAFLAQHTITCKLSRSTFKIRSCVRKYILTVYISSRHLAFLTVARTCKYEFPVFARFQLCNALSHGNTKSTEYTENDVKTSTNTKTVEQGLYRRMDRSGFAVEPRINRRCGKADMRCFAYDRPPRISDVVRVLLNLFRENKRGNSTDILPKLLPVLSLFSFFFRLKIFDWKKRCKVAETWFMLAHEKARI